MSRPPTSRELGKQILQLWERARIVCVSGHSDAADLPVSDQTAIATPPRRIRRCRRLE
jgi:hypothetical protein